MLFESHRIISEVADILEKTYRDGSFPRHPIFTPFKSRSERNIFWAKYMQMIRNTQKNILICSSDFTPIEIIIELIAGFHFISIKMIQSGKLTSQELYYLMSNARDLKKHPFWFSCSDEIDETIIDENEIEIVITIFRNSLSVHLVDKALGE